MESAFSFQSREKHIRQLIDEEQDLIVIGGGITGAGILLDATTRGLKAALFEMQDFSQGTSSRSTKLVHGGLRYLKQLEFGLVKEVGRERAIVYENGPHITQPEPMLLPVVQGGSIGKAAAYWGMWLYDWLAGVKSEERRKILSKDTTLSYEPLLNQEKLVGGAYYYEYRTDDARLTIEVLKKAVELGARALNYCKVSGFLYTNKKITGVQVTDLCTGTSFEIRGKVVINATGPWTDATDALDPSARQNKLLLSKGIHIVVDASRLPIRQALYFDAGKGRMVFAIPRSGKVYIGTTESEYQHDPGKPEITTEERDYLLTATNTIFSGCGLTAKDVESGWAGLRPLIRQEGKKPGEVSRKDEIFESPAGLYSIAGGKLTGYRKMAERITDRVSRRLQKEYGLPFQNCKTAHTLLSGGIRGGASRFPEYKKQLLAKASPVGWSKEVCQTMVERYGSNCEKIFELADHLPQEPYNLSPSRLAELEYTIRYEMVVSPLDFVVRRTGDAYFNLQRAQEEQEAIVQYMAARFAWSPQQTAQHRLDLEKEIKYLSSLNT
jgi:glycerol-3-phosphate dehydrogenase